MVLQFDLLLFRARSWNNGMRCMSYYVLTCVGPDQGVLCDRLAYLYLGLLFK